LAQNRRKPGFLIKWNRLLDVPGSKGVYRLGRKKRSGVGHSALEDLLTSLEAFAVTADGARMPKTSTKDERLRAA
jgi:hypothetical protein